MSIQKVPKANNYNKISPSVITKYTSNANGNQKHQMAANCSVIPLSAGNLVASSLAKRIQYPSKQAEGQRSNTPSFEALNSNCKLNLQSLLSKKDSLWTACTGQGSNESGASNNFTQSTLSRSDQSVFTFVKKSSDNVQNNMHPTQAQNSVSQGMHSTVDCAQRLQERLAELRRSCSRSQVSFPAKQVSQTSNGATQLLDARQMQSSATNPQISLASVARPESSNSAFKLQLKLGSKMLNFTPRPVDRNAKLASSAVPELSRVNSDLFQPMKFPIAQHANNHNRSSSKIGNPSKEQATGAKDVASMLQENIEMIKNLKDELSIEQLQLIKSICQGKLDEMQGSATQKPKFNGQEDYQEATKKPQPEKCQSEQPEAELMQEELFDKSPKHMKGAIQTTQQNFQISKSSSDPEIAAKNLIESKSQPAFNGINQVSQHGRSNLSKLMMELNPKTSQLKKQDSVQRKDDISANPGVDNKMNKHLLQLILNKIRSDKSSSSQNPAALNTQRISQDRSVNKKNVLSSLFKNNRDHSMSASRQVSGKMGLGNLKITTKQAADDSESQILITRSDSKQPSFLDCFRQGNIKLNLNNQPQNGCSSHAVAALDSNRESSNNAQKGETTQKSHQHDCSHDHDHDHHHCDHAHHHHHHDHCHPEGTEHSFQLVTKIEQPSSSNEVTSSCFGGRFDSQSLSKEGPEDNEEKSIILTRDQIEDQSILNQIPLRCNEIEVIQGSKISLNQKLKINQKQSNPHIPSTQMFRIFKFKNPETQRYLKILKCDYPDCPMNFRKWHNFYDHLRIHTNERPYSCPYAVQKNCKLTFTQKSNLNKHVKSHLLRNPDLKPDCEVDLSKFQGSEGCSPLLSQIESSDKLSSRPQSSKNSATLLTKRSFANLDLNDKENDGSSSDCKRQRKSQESSEKQCKLAQQTKQCKFCDQTFKNIHHLNRHINAYHADENMKTLPEDQKSVDEQMKPSEEAGQIFNKMDGCHVVTDAQNQQYHHQVPSTNESGSNSQVLGICSQDDQTQVTQGDLAPDCIPLTNFVNASQAQPSAVKTVI